MTRFKAAGIHLGICALIAIVVLAVMLGVWYPGAYFQLMGGDKLLFLIIGVDVCLGPLATLVVFKSGKKGLKFDLTVIALIQAAALIYGTHVMFVARPAYTVFVINKFRVAAANDIKQAELDKALRPEWQKIPLLGPQMVFGRWPVGKEGDDMTMLAMSGTDLHQFPKHYAPYSENVGEVLKQAKPLKTLLSLSRVHKERVERFLRKHNRPEQDFVIVPIRSRDTFMTVVLDAKTGEYLEMLDVDPYPDS